MTDSDCTLSFDKKQLNEFLENEIAFYQLPRERISDLLLAQLYILAKLRIHNIFYITDEIKYLEGITKSTKTVKEKPFNGDLLKGLWKKHFYSDRFIYKNIASYLSNRKGGKEFDNYIKHVLSENEGDFIDEKTINKISDFASFGIFKRKLSHAGKKKNALTGEWIIFGKQNDQNYYLCVAQHDKGDDKIRSQILSVCADEFPFLAEDLAQPFSARVQINPNRWDSR